MKRLLIIIGTFMICSFLLYSCRCMNEIENDKAIGERAKETVSGFLDTCRRGQTQETIQEAKEEYFDPEISTKPVSIPSILMSDFEYEVSYEGTEEIINEAENGEKQTLYIVEARIQPVNERGMSLLFKCSKAGENIYSISIMYE